MKSININGLILFNESEKMELIEILSSMSPYCGKIICRPGSYSTLEGIPHNIAQQFKVLMDKPFLACSFQSVISKEFEGVNAEMILSCGIQRKVSFTPYSQHICDTHLSLVRSPALPYHHDISLCKKICKSINFLCEEVWELSSKYRVMVLYISHNSKAVDIRKVYGDI